MKTEQLIQSLATQAAPVKTTSYQRLMVEWLCLTLGSLMAITLLYGLRADLSQQLSTTSFQIEIMANTMLFLFSGFGAIHLAYPRKLSKLVPTSLVIVGAIYVAAILYKIATPAEQSVDLHHSHSIYCLLCILSFAAIPAIYILWRLKQLATTNPAILGALCLLMATSAGAIGVLLVESEVVSTGLILWHYLPLAVISALGYAIGKKIFRW